MKMINGRNPSDPPEAAMCSSFARRALAAASRRLGLLLTAMVRDKVCALPACAALANRKADRSKLSKSIR